MRRGRDAGNRVLFRWDGRYSGGTELRRALFEPEAQLQSRRLKLNLCVLKLDHVGINTKNSGVFDDQTIA